MTDTDLYQGETKYKVSWKYLHYFLSYTYHKIVVTHRLPNIFQYAQGILKCASPSKPKIEKIDQSSTIFYFYKKKSNKLDIKAKHLPKKYFNLF